MHLNIAIKELTIYVTELRFELKDVQSIYEFDGLKKTYEVRKKEIEILNEIEKIETVLNNVLDAKKEYQKKNTLLNRIFNKKTVLSLKSSLRIAQVAVLKLV